MIHLGGLINKNREKGLKKGERGKEYTKSKADEIQKRE